MTTPNGIPCASSPSATGTTSVDPIASADASSESVPNTSQAAGGADGDGDYAGFLLDQLRDENERLRGVIAKQRAQLAAIPAVLHQLQYGEASEGDLDDIAWCARALRGGVIEEPMPSEFPRPYSVASPARLDGDASGRGA